MEAIWITLIIIAAIVAILIYAVVDTKKTINSPDITVSAYLERKFFVDYAGDDELEKKYHYFAVFRLDNGKKLELRVNESDYVFLPESGSCVITYSYKSLINFQSRV